MSTRSAALAALVALGAGLGVVAPAQAATAHAARVQAATIKTPKKISGHRRGGRVRAAWPRDAHADAPRSPLARWLARQVGPAARRPAAAPRATAAQTTSSLALVRSFDIPKDDSHYAALRNYSWLYDNGLATMAFIAAGSKTEATQLLDQLAALQNADGSLDFAFDVSSGAGTGLVRSGALAWIGLGAADYRRTYASTRYDTLLGGIVKYLLAQRMSDGLVKGGPDVSWVSTQHNLLVVGLLRDLQSQLSGTTKTIGGLTSNDYNTVQTTMGNAIVSKLLVQDGALAHFVEGVGDTRIPTDVQALGAMYLRLRGDARSYGVAGYVQQAGFFLGPRLSADGSGIFSGLRPYYDSASPNAIWSEGTIETQVMLRRMGLVNAAVTAGVTTIAASADGSSAGPIGSDRESESSWGEYHQWPTSAAASWLLMLAAQAGLPLLRY